MKSKMTVAPVLVAMTFGLTAHADRWNQANDPSMLDKNYEYHFSALPLEATLETKPWSETYWPTFEGSINVRWNTENPDGFRYSPPSKERVMQMSVEELKALSPAEKFDIYLGRYNYPIHDSVAGFASPRVASWKGICDGWTMSALQFAEPQPIEVKNPDGVTVPFGSSDIKGLLSYYAQFHSGAKQVYVGGQCHGILGGLFGGSACSDINPGALQVILANQIGMKKQGFAIDRDAGRQIWNQPVFGYKTTVMGSARSSAAQGLLVQTTLYYTDELDASSWTAVGGTDKFAFDTIEMEYVLDLDSEGRIVGGTYSKASDHPDLAWLTDSKIEFNAEFSKLGDLIQK